MRRLSWMLAVTLAGCSSPPPSVVAPVDQTMLNEARAGGLAFALDRPAEAVTHYRAALARARLRDDLPGITDAGTNLAVAELRANQPEQALADARATRAELARRGAAEVPVLELVEATALYRTGQIAAADQMASTVQHAGDPQAAARASFLRGLIADAHGDAAGLAAARQALDPKADSEQAADALELESRQQLRQHNFAAAHTDAEHAATLRRDLPDYRGLARDLALAAQAAQAQGDIEAASDLYLRAGRSAAVQGDTADAKIWLQRAQSGDPTVAEQARQILASLAP